MLKEETLRQNDTKSSIPVSANMFMITEKPLQTSGMNLSYLLAGLGVVMSMLLFIIVIEIYKKCRPSGTKPTSEQSNYVNQNRNRFNHQQDTVYNEISDCMDIIHHSHCSNATSDQDHVFPLQFHSIDLEKQTSF